MARQLRVSFDGAIYHVYHRGAARQDTFLDDHDRRCFMALLGESFEKYTMETHAFALMSNHYHLLVRTPIGNLSRAMQHLNSVYTQRFNRHHDRDGALFRGRFGSQLIADSEYLRVVASYIHLNPVRATITPHPADYRWSSYSAYAGTATPPDWLHQDLVLEAFGNDREHRAFIDGLAANPDRAIEPNLDAPILAPPPVTRSILESSERCRETDPSRHRAQARPSCDLIELHVAIECGVSIGSLRTSTRGQPNVPRDIALQLACTLGGLTGPEASQRFGYANARSVTAAIQRVKRRRADSEELDLLASDIEKQLATRMQALFDEAA